MWLFNSFVSDVASCFTFDSSAPSRASPGTQYFPEVGKKDRTGRGGGQERGNKGLGMMRREMIEGWGVQNSWLESLQSK